MFQFIIHASEDTLCNYISQAALPSDYNGDVDSILHINAEWVEKLRASKEKLKKRSTSLKFVKKKSVQIMKASPFSDIYDNEGTIRSLTID
jgi:hypothetical protein